MAANDVRRACPDCSTVFVLTADEVAFFKARRLTIPFRCERCRQAAKLWRDVKARREHGGARVPEDDADAVPPDGERGRDGDE